MLDGQKHAKLLETIDEHIGMRERWLATAKKTRYLCDFLPEEIKPMCIITVECIEEDSREGLKIHIMAKDGELRTLKTLGIQGLKIKAFTTQTLYAEGDGRLTNGGPLHVLISSFDKPAGCTLKKKRSWTTEYEVVCPRQGKEA